MIRLVIVSEVSSNVAILKSDEKLLLIGKKCYWCLKVCTIVQTYEMLLSMMTSHVVTSIKFGRWSSLDDEGQSLDSSVDFKGGHMNMLHKGNSGYLSSNLLSRNTFNFLK